MLASDIISEIIRIADDDSGTAIRLMQLNRQFRDVARRIRAHSKREFYDACKRGQFLIVHNFMFTYRDEWGFDSGTAFNKACSGGHVAIAKLLDNNVHLQDESVFSAFASGNADMIRYITHKSLLISGEIHLQSAFTGACRCGNIDTIEKLWGKDVKVDDRVIMSTILSKNPHTKEFISNNYGAFSNIAWENYSYQICKSGDMQMITSIMPKSDLSLMLNGACAGNHAEVIRMLLSVLTSDSRMYRSGILATACKYCDLSIICELQTKFRLSFDFVLKNLCKFGRYLDFVLSNLNRVNDVTEILIHACGYPHIVRRILPIAPSRINWARLDQVNDCHPESMQLFINAASGADIRWDNPLSTACICGDKLIVEMILAFHIPDSWDKLMENAVKSGNLSLFKMLECRCQSIEWNRIMDVVYTEGHMDMIRYVSTKATNLDDLLRKTRKNVPLTQFLLDSGARYW